MSGSDDFTLCLYSPSTSKTPIARMTGHVQLINQVRAVPWGEEERVAQSQGVVRLKARCRTRHAVQCRLGLAPVGGGLGSCWASFRNSWCFAF